MRFDELMEYAREEGRKEERRQTLIDLLETYGEISAELRTVLEEEDDLEKLRKWIGLAAKVRSVSEFADKM